MIEIFPHPYVDIYYKKIIDFLCLIPFLLLWTRDLFCTVLSLQSNFSMSAVSKL